MRRLVFAAMVCLMACAAFMFYRIASLPEADDIIQNEVSLMAEQNMDTRTDLKEVAQRIRSQARTQQRHRVKLAGEVAERVDRLTDSAAVWFDRAIAAAEPVNLPERLASSVIVFDYEVTGPAEGLDSAGVARAIADVTKEVNDAGRMRSRQATMLALEVARYNFYELLYFYLDALNAVTDVATLKVDIGFPTRPEGPSLGTIAFHTPGVMELKEKYRLTVRISKELSDELLGQLPPGEKATMDSLLVGDIMVVRLQGDDFDIRSWDEEEQGVLPDGYTQWEFDVTPLSTGTHSLFVKAGIVYPVAGMGTARKFFPVYEKAIEIEVNNWKRLALFATERWEFLVSTFLVPLGTWAVTGWRRRRVVAKQEGSK